MPKKPVMNWQYYAAEAIRQALASAPKDADLIKVIDAAYPFGQRKYRPYQIWLDERKKALIRLNLYKAPGEAKRKCKYHPDGQTCLICMNKEQIND